MARRSQRPGGVTALSIFFMAGALISFIAGLSLLIPGSFLEPLWRINPRGHEGLVRIGSGAVVLLFVASLSCAAAAGGLWRGKRWGHRVAAILLAINLLSDIANGLLGTELRALVGIPIALALIFYLMSKGGRKYFDSPS